MGTIHPASHLKKTKTQRGKAIYLLKSPIFFKMVSRLGCLFSELVPSVSLRFACKSSFWNKGKEPSFQDSLLTSPSPRGSTLIQNPTEQASSRETGETNLGAAASPAIWSLPGSSRSSQLPPTPTLALTQTIRGSVLGQLKEAGFLSTTLTPMSESVVKPRDYEKSDSDNVSKSLRKKELKIWKTAILFYR